MFSPYISLTKLLESDPQLADLSQNAWAALNDVYRTDAPIVYAPHVLALGCLYLASVICSRDITAWLEGVEADMDQVWWVHHSGRRRRRVHVGRTQDCFSRLQVHNSVCLAEGKGSAIVQ